MNAFIVAFNGQLRAGRWRLSSKQPLWTACLGRDFNKSKTMEARFLTSTSFTKTIQLVPSNKSTIRVHPKAYAKQLKGRKVGLLFPVSCCHMESSSLPSEDNNTDWRSFRAKLVAGERASRFQESSSYVDPDVVVDDQPPPISIGDKWAHSIHEPEKGCLLIATAKLDGVHIFERTVVLVLSMGPLGPSGIILNRPSLMSIKETRPTMIDVEGTFSDRPLFFGGPLEESLFLVNTKGGNDDGVERGAVFEEVIKGLYYGTKESVGCAAEMVKRNVVGVGDFRFFDGYCGWEKEQLRDEIRAGYWRVAACSPSVVGLASVGSVGMWEEVLGLMDPTKVW